MDSGQHRRITLSVRHALSKNTHDANVLEKRLKDLEAQRDSNLSSLENMKEQTAQEAGVRPQTAQRGDGVRRTSGALTPSFKTENLSLSRPTTPNRLPLLTTPDIYRQHDRPKSADHKTRRATTGSKQGLQRTGSVPTSPRVTPRRRSSLPEDVISELVVRLDKTTTASLGSPRKTSQTDTKTSTAQTRKHLPSAGDRSRPRTAAADSQRTKHHPPERSVDASNDTHNTKNTSTRNNHAFSGLGLRPLWKQSETGSSELRKKSEAGSKKGKSVFSRLYQSSLPKREKTPRNDLDTEAPRSAQLGRRRRSISLPDLSDTMKDCRYLR